MEQRKIHKISYGKGGILFAEEPDTWINPVNKEMLPEIQNLREGDMVDVEINEKDRYTFIRRIADHSEKVLGLDYEEPKGIFDGVFPRKAEVKQASDEFKVINDKLDKIIKHLKI